MLAIAAVLKFSCPNRAMGSKCWNGFWWTNNILRLSWHDRTYGNLVKPMLPKVRISSWVMFFVRVSKGKLEPTLLDEMSKCTKVDARLWSLGIAVIKLFGTKRICKLTEEAKFGQNPIPHKVSFNSTRSSDYIVNVSGQKWGLCLSFLHHKFYLLSFWHILTSAFGNLSSEVATFLTCRKLSKDSMRVWLTNNLDSLVDWFILHFHSQKLRFLCLKTNTTQKDNSLLTYVSLWMLERSMFIGISSYQLSLFDFRISDFKFFNALFAADLLWGSVNIFYSWQTFESYLVQLSWTIFWVLT